MKYFIHIFNLFIVSGILLFSFNDLAYAIETAPRISDREIIESLAELKQGQRNLEKRIDDLNNRIDGLQAIMLSMFGAIVALNIAIIGFIIWDRRTAMRPMEARIARLELDHQSFEFQHKDGSTMVRLLNALRELAQTDKKLAKVLKSFSLM